MTTKFKLIFEDKEPDVDLSIFRRSLPPQFAVTQEPDGIYVSIPSPTPEDRQCQGLIDRELDRHYFLTFVKIKADMVRKKILKAFRAAYACHGALPENILPQVWDKQLPIQLRLWSLASETEDHTLKALLLFQIIELTYPTLNSNSDYPEYKDSSNPPAPRTECKFIRHLVAHSGHVEGTQLKRYCNYLGICERMFEPTDSDHVRILKRKIPCPVPLDLHHRRSIAVPPGVVHGLAELLALLGQLVALAVFVVAEADAKGTHSMGTLYRRFLNIRWSHLSVTVFIWFIHVGGVSLAPLILTFSLREKGRSGIGWVLSSWPSPAGRRDATPPARAGAPRRR